jgi:hypothetical protein
LENEEAFRVSDLLREERLDDFGDSISEATKEEVVDFWGGLGAFEKSREVVVSPMKVICSH